MLDETMFMFILALFEEQMMQANNVSDCKTFYPANNLLWIASPACSSLFVSLEFSTISNRSNGMVEET